MTKTTTMHIIGMHCTSCKMLIEDVCKETPGVQECTVDFETGNGTLVHDESVNLATLKTEIEGMGEYQVVFND